MNNKNNGNYKKRYEQLMEEFDKLRAAYELESGQVWFGEYEEPTEKVRTFSWESDWWGTYLIEDGSDK